MKTPSELAPWTGDLGMKMHAHKPGSSESVSITDIISLINVDGSLKSGDIILRPDAAYRVNSPEGAGIGENYSNGEYTDALKCNGHKHLREDHPALAETLSFLQVGNAPTGFGPETSMKTGLQEGQNALAGMLTVRANYFNLTKFPPGSNSYGVRSRDGGETFQADNTAYTFNKSDFVDDDGAVVHFNDSTLYVYEPNGTIGTYALPGLGGSIVGMAKGSNYFVYTDSGEVWQSNTLRGTYGLLGSFNDGLRPASQSRCFVMFNGQIHAALVSEDGSTGGIYSISGAQVDFAGGTSDVFTCLCATEGNLYAQTTGNILKFDTTFNVVSYINNYTKFGSAQQSDIMKPIGESGLLVKSVNNLFLSNDGGNTFALAASSVNAFDYDETLGLLYYAQNTGTLNMKAGTFASTVEFSTPKIESELPGFAWYIMR
ncbi:hypothetical protein [Pseudomonas guariconensis]|uniref:hypothetical protein n=1 Tax=Pseudomonas guariconensis TaxID=1288410 RepID=UPI0018AB3826|nr:hypothetical protein [Pseudomonas guariconensis]MBF8755505.1 hypothetical protein [Pseudomonas guariconensis]